MQSSSRHRYSTLAAAPPALSLISFLILVSATLIPPDFYKSIMMEDDLMYLNIGIVALFVVYWVVFLAGYMLGNRISARPRRFDIRRFATIGVHLLVALILVEIASFIYSFDVLYRRIPDILGNFLNGNVQRTKRELIAAGTSGAFSIIVPISNGTFWWISFRWEALARSTSATFKTMVLYPLIAGFAAVILVYSTLLGARFEIVPLVFGLMIVFYVKKKIDNTPFSAKARLLLLLFPAVLIGIFVFFALLRGASGFDGLMYSLMGYGPASYNRLAAILDGTLIYDDQYGILNELEFLFHFPFEQRLLPLDSVFNLPQGNEIGLYSQQVAGAHLVKGFMWSSIFGQIYSDMGLFSFFYMLIYGVAAGLIWKLIVCKRPFGILLYPWMAFSVIMWLGYDIFPAQDLSALILMSLLFAVFEQKFARR